MRTTRLALGATAATAALTTVPSAMNALVAEPTALVAWWEQVGTAAATIAVLHLLVTAAFAYVAVVASLMVIADAVRFAALRRVVLRVATPQLRRWLAAGIIASAVALPAPAFAEESTIVVTDLGPSGVTDTPTFTLTDLGPTDTDPALVDASIDVPLVSTAAVRDSFRPRSAAPVADAWLVEAGDNLWTIAESVVGDDEPTVARYWNALIEANTNTVADPDLIFPGQVLTLPPIATAGS